MIEGTMKKNYQDKIKKTKKLIEKADLILIGAGAGLSSAAGLEYGGKRFENNFRDFIQKYGLSDMYSSGFYEFPTAEEKWAYWSRHIQLNRFDILKNRVYPELLQIVKEKNYFLITTNADGLFERSGFEKSKMFVVQGDYAKIQCAKPCHQSLYENKEQIEVMIQEQQECKIPSYLIPRCPICNGPMEMNLRKDTTFVQDVLWYEQYNAYETFVQSMEDKNIVLLELGVGYNTPSIIKYPFEHITAQHANATLIRMNKEYDEISLINKTKTIVFEECISKVFEDLSNVD
jgi:NAD-dependent SIR2 family protein deacetylase